MASFQVLGSGADIPVESNWIVLKVNLKKNASACLGRNATSFRFPSRTHQPFQVELNTKKSSVLGLRTKKILSPRTSRNDPDASFCCLGRVSIWIVCNYAVLSNYYTTHIPLKSNSTQKNSGVFPDNPLPTSSLSGWEPGVFASGCGQLCRRGCKECRDDVEIGGEVWWFPSTSTCHMSII